MYMHTDMSAGTYASYVRIYMNAPESSDTVSWQCDVSLTTGAVRRIVFQLGAEINATVQIIGCAKRPSPVGGCSDPEYRSAVWLCLGIPLTEAVRAGWSSRTGSASTKATFGSGTRAMLLRCSKRWRIPSAAPS